MLGEEEDALEEGRLFQAGIRENEVSLERIVHNIQKDDVAGASQRRKKILEHNFAIGNPEG